MKRIIFLLIGMLAFMTCQDEDEFIPFSFEEDTPNPEWKTYLKGYEIEHIADAGNYLWLTNEKDVMKFDKNTGNAVYYSLDNIETSPDYRITSITCSENGLPWVGITYTGILKMNEDKQWIVLPPVPEPKFVNVGDILIADTDIVWTWMNTPFSISISVGGTFSTALEEMETILVRYQGSTVDTFTIDNPISSLAEDNDGNLWIGEWNWTTSTLVKYDGENWTTFDCPQFGNGLKVIGDIAFDESGNIWMFGTFGLIDSTSVLLQFNGSEWQVYDLPVEYTWIRSLTLQDDEVIWLGTTNGLMKFNDSQWTVYQFEYLKLPSNDVNSIVIDANGTKWIGTDNGLAAFNENSL